MPYRLRDDFLSPGELSFYHILKSMMGQYFTICTKVALPELFLSFNQMKTNPLLIGSAASGSIFWCALPRTWNRYLPSSSTIIVTIGQIEWSAIYSWTLFLILPDCLYCISLPGTAMIHENWECSSEMRWQLRKAEGRIRKSSLPKCLTLLQKNQRPTTKQHSLKKPLIVQSAALKWYYAQLSKALLQGSDFGVVRITLIASL